MSTFNFADHYRAAGLNPGPEILRLRQEPFEQLRQGLTPAFAVILTRMYFGRPPGDGVETFRAAFAAPDSSFSLVDNTREVAVLAGCLLAAALADGKVFAGLAPTCAAVAGQRTPFAAASLLSEFSHTVAQRAIDQRIRGRANPTTLKSPAASKIGDETTALAGAGEWGKAAALIKQVSDESLAAAAALASQTASIVRPLAADVADLREEVAMLWWYVGGWSRGLDRPFTDLGPAATALLAGLDLADLSCSQAGPVSAPALLSRIVKTARKARGAKLSISEAIGEMKAEELGMLTLPDASTIQNAFDVCPVHCALVKARESGGGQGWHAAFEHVTGLGADAEFKPLDLSLQAYREGLFLKSLS